MRAAMARAATGSRKAARADGGERGAALRRADAAERDAEERQERRPRRPGAARCARRSGRARRAWPAAAVHREERRDPDVAQRLRRRTLALALARCLTRKARTSSYGRLGERGPEQRARRGSAASRSTRPERTLADVGVAGVEELAHVLRRRGRGLGEDLSRPSATASARTPGAAGARPGRAPREPPRRALGFCAPSGGRARPPARPARRRARRTARARAARRDVFGHQLAQERERRRLSMREQLEPLVDGEARRARVVRSSSAAKVCTSSCGDRRSVRTRATGRSVDRDSRGATARWCTRTVRLRARDQIEQRVGTPSQTAGANGAG